MTTTNVEDLSMQDKLKILDFYCACVQREHSDILRLSKLGKLLVKSAKDKKTKTKLNDITKRLDTIYSELKDVI